MLGAGREGRVAPGVGEQGVDALAAGGHKEGEPDEDVDGHGDAGDGDDEGVCGHGVEEVAGDGLAAVEIAEDGNDEIDYGYCGGAHRDGLHDTPLTPAWT